MRLVTLVDGMGRLEPDGSISRLQVETPSLREQLAYGDGLDGLRTASVADRVEVDPALLAPLAGRGATVWGIGLNYRSKLVATGRDLPDHPVLFVKGCSSICTDVEPIRLPSVSQCVDFEAEIAVLIGAALFEVTPQRARNAIAGIGAANDVTARDVMRRLGSPSLAKSFPGFGQLGSVVATDLDVLSAPVGLSAHVNGVPRQADDSSGMLLPVDELLSLLSRYTVLRPGDVVLTGTPAGTGDEEQRYLAPGDLVEIVVGDLPPLRSRVAESTRPH